RRAHATLGGATPAARAPVRDASPVRPTARPALEPAVMTVEHHAFVPRVLVVPRGTAVRFVNHDGVYHEIFSNSPVRRFDTGSAGPLQSRVVTFDTPGVVPLF